MDRFSKNTQISNFSAIHPMEAELLHADRQTDMMKLMVTFCNFVNVLVIILQSITILS